MSESELQTAVADYIRLHYPDVLFHSDFGSGIKLTMGQAAKQKRQNGGRRGWPDMFIAKPKLTFHGLFLELKKDGTRLWKKNGDPTSEHIEEQANTLIELNNLGYWAEFAIGFDEAVEIIDKYMNL